VHGSKRDGDNGKRGSALAGDTKDVFFHVHMMHEDHVQTINGDEVLNFCSGFFNVRTARSARRCKNPPEPTT
jgi:hypothetical protein